MLDTGYTHGLVNSKGLVPKFYKKVYDADVNTREPIVRGPGGEWTGGDLISTARVQKEVDYIEIRVAGDNQTVWNGKVTDEHRDMFPDYWNAYKKGLDGPLGTPLSKIDWLSADHVNFLATKNIHTLEQLAELGENGVGNIGPGGRQLVRKAYEELRRRTQGTVEQENVALKTQLADLSEKMSWLMEQVQQGKLAMGPADPVRRGPGRPKADPE